MIIEIDGRVKRGYIEYPGVRATELRGEMTGSIENMTFNARIERLGELAAAFVAALRDEGTSMKLIDILNKVAATLRVALNQAKYGLTYARSQGMIVVNERKALVSLPA